MRVVTASFVAVLVPHFADEKFNDARFTLAVIAMLAQVTRSFG
jgi:hypothetical protein